MTSPGGLTAWSVQFVIAVDNPVNNVRMTIKGKTIHFEIPLNHPDAHKGGLFYWFQEAMRIEQEFGRPDSLIPRLKNKTSPSDSTVV